MLKLFKILLLALVMGVFISCEKESENTDDNIAQDNFIKYGTEQVDVGKSDISNCFGTDEGGPKFQKIAFSTNGIDLNEGTGTGSAIVFIVYNNDCIEDGTYTYTYSTQYANGKFEDNGFVWNSNFEDDNNWISIQNGNLTLKKIGTSYEIEFTCQTSESKELSGYFKGNLE